MSTAALLFLIASSQFFLSVQGLTLRLNGKEIESDRSVRITDLPVGGCRRYNTLECLSDVPYRGRVEKAYWVYTDEFLKDHEVDDIRCKVTAGGCKNPEIGWQSNKGIYKNGSSYFGAVRLGRNATNPVVGSFTCHFEGDSNSPVTVEIVSGHPPTDPHPSTTDPPIIDPTTTYPSTTDPHIIDPTTTHTHPSTTVDPSTNQHISWVPLPPAPTP